MTRKTIFSYGVVILCVLVAWVASLVILKQVVLVEVQRKIGIPVTGQVMPPPMASSIPSLLPPQVVPPQVAASNASENSDFSGLFANLADSGVTPLGRRMFERSYLFALTGDKCPRGTTVYEGPEQYFARQDGFIFCWIYRDTIAFLRSELKKCPQGMIEHKDEGTKADDTYLQCKRAPIPEGISNRASASQPRQILTAPAVVDGLPPGLPPFPGQTEASESQVQPPPVASE